MSPEQVIQYIEFLRAINGVPIRYITDDNLHLLTAASEKSHIRIQSGKIFLTDKGFWAAWGKWR